MKKSAKDRIKKRIEETRRLFRACHAKDRAEDIAEHNGKPFTSHNTPTPKNKYNRKKIAKDGYE